MATPTPETALLDKIEAALVEFRLTPTAFGRLTVSTLALVLPPGGFRAFLNDAEFFDRSSCQ